MIHEAHAGAARRRRHTTLLPAALVALLAATACAPGGDGGDSPSEEPAPGQAYTVRGEVTATPGEGDLTENQVRIHHEAIPGFVGYDGEVVGMASMTMPFPAADTVELGELAVGDKIEFTFEVNWDDSPGYRITAIRKLPPETELDFGRKEELPGEKGVAETEPTPP